MKGFNMNCTPSLNILPGLFIVLWFGLIIFVIVYLICLFARLVKAHEKLANSVEKYCHEKGPQPL